MDPWPHQVRGVKAVVDAIYNGVRRIILTTPTGGGKTKEMEMILQVFIDRQMPGIIYTNRRWLMDQLSEDMTKADIQHGVRADGHPLETEYPIQIASMQTEIARWSRKKVWELHPAKIVLVDEGHLHGGEESQKIIQKHVDDGAAVVYITATPLDMPPADKLIVAGTPSELFQCKALLPVRTYAPDEPDMAGLKKLLAKIENGADLTQQEIAVAINPPKLFGRIYANYERINPEHLPGILFAGGVNESLWFAQQFTAKGIRAAHIDGDDIWVDGEFLASDSDNRKRLAEQSENGELPVVCNRFVMREGINWPWLAHGIFATIFGSLKTYMQAGGRLMRYYEGYTHKTLQDHGGNYWRHGSLNIDRDWQLDDTNDIVADRRNTSLREKRCRKCKGPLLPGLPICPKCHEKNEVQPTTCPKCFMVFLFSLGGRNCPGCGHLFVGNKVARAVMTVKGDLKMVEGDAIRKRRPYTGPNGPAIWKKMYFRARSLRTVTKIVDGKEQTTEVGWNGTFRAAAALFAKENNWGWPSPDWPYMPKDRDAMHRLIADVPMNELIPEPTQ